MKHLAIGVTCALLTLGVAGMVAVPLAAQTPSPGDLRATAAVLAGQMTALAEQAREMERAATQQAAVTLAAMRATQVVEQTRMAAQATRDAGVAAQATQAMENAARATQISAAATTVAEGTRAAREAAAQETREAIALAAQATTTAVALQRMQRRDAGDALAENLPLVVAALSLLAAGVVFVVSRLARAITTRRTVYRPAEIVGARQTTQNTNSADTDADFGNGELSQWKS